MCLKVARKVYPNNENLRVAYMLGFNDGFGKAKELLGKAKEQQEADLEKEILDWIGDEGSCKNGKWTWYECNKMIRHFYELGFNARKEE